ncbi:ATP synthase F1 subunit gamma [Metamycoplasma equirhinis]|uniref:ATP synthase gamma chain n=1 Tax=Metamycoplasma equirhinis TaxID=92402 RepID=A0ABZ0PA00_9BACT|nr:ATP synthase F1 subunit gamma [Metamycoplasma equirhinis]TPD99413.1 ATP synthase F1 subunit gamma [Metamycoplasma equirhinis]WPB53843.1 ATP synthase F1 subunit gamma [Metamycoplasma equirhinis]BDX52872.1 ATP synthase gamma chain [Metamycoplasma equirhinis]
MESLQKIKHRIYSVNSTKKITKAMQLVAAAKFSKIKRKQNDVEAYYKSVKYLFINLVKNIDQDIDKLLNESAYKFAAKRNLYIVFGSDLGLCGSYNSEMFKKIKAEVKTEDMLIVIGNKLLSLIQRDKTFHIIQTLIQIGDDPSYDIAKIISTKIYDVLQISLLKSVKLIYTNYVNPINTTPIVKEIFPISNEKITEESEELQNEIDSSSFEPNAEEILKNSFALFFEASIYNALMHAKLSEMSQRRTAMETASDNAEDLISDLHIEYNGSRQAKITQELTEIVNGSNS